MNSFMRPRLTDLNLYFVQWDGIKQSNIISNRTQLGYTQHPPEEVKFQNGLSTLVYSTEYYIPYSSLDSE